MSKANYQICTRCVMDTFDPDIVFDNNGYCNHCRNYINTLQQLTYRGESSYKQLLQSIESIKEKGKGRKYDCIMGISGGVDSCYSAYLAKQHGLRVLLMHMDNGWDSEIAVQNIKNVNKHLGFDYISYVLDWAEFREIQLAFLRSGIVDLEMPTDIAIAASIYETAAKYGVKFIISGGNLSGEGILPLQMGYHVLKDMKLYKYIVKKFSKVKLKTIPTVGLWGEFYYKFVKNIRTFYILNYVDFNKDEAREFLIENLDWKDYGGKHHESKITGFWQGYAMPYKYNMDYRRTTFASQICEGQVSRKEALLLLEKEPYDENKAETDLQYVAKKYGISSSELRSILEEPPKTYVDFPNNKRLITAVYDLYRKLFPGKRL